MNEQNYDEVICPNCVHQFRAIPVNVQIEMRRIKGEQTVLIGLLRESLSIVDIADGDDSGECEALMDLSNRMKAAINGAMKGLL